MKLIKEHIYEYFEKGKDNLSSLSIGKRGLIEKWLDKYSFENRIGDSSFICKAKINEDSLMTIDAASVVLLEENIGVLPDYIQFRDISQNFVVDNCQLTSLKGFPVFVGGMFSVSDNNLLTLDYAPTIIHSTFYCDQNPNLQVEEILKFLNEYFKDSNISKSLITDYVIKYDRVNKKYFKKD